MKLTVEQWAVICAIKQQPDYHFVGPEKAMAQRLVNRGLLRWNPEKSDQCLVTVAGWEAFTRGYGTPAS